MLLILMRHLIEALHNRRKMSKRNVIINKGPFYLTSTLEIICVIII